MPRRRSAGGEAGEEEGVEGEAFDAGRYISSLERAGYKELIDEIRARARAEGKSVTDKLAEVIAAGLSYEKYEDVTLADVMKVMDFLERFFNKFMKPTMETVGLFQVTSNIQQVQAIAEALGYAPRELIERLAEEKAREILAKQQSAEKGIVSKFIDRLSEAIASKLGEETIKRLVESGKLDEFIEALGEVALRSLGEGGGGGGGGVPSGPGQGQG